MYIEQFCCHSSGYKIANTYSYIQTAPYFTAAPREKQRTLTYQYPTHNSRRMNTYTRLCFQKTYNLIKFK